MIIRANRNTLLHNSRYWLDKKVISSAGRVTKYKEFPYKYNKFLQTEEMRYYKTSWRFGTLRSELLTEEDKQELIKAFRVRPDEEVEQSRIKVYNRLVD